MTPPLPTLTIAVCTRDRPRDVERCVRSVVAAEWPRAAPAAEVLVVDDDEMAASLVSRLERLVTARGHRFRYLAPQGPHGLIFARVAAIRQATSEVLLFLDDDVEIAPDYLPLLLQWHVRHPEAAGVGGVDVLTPIPTALKRCFDRVFLHDSGIPGKLAASGFSGSMGRWGRERQPFASDFLSGCNMSFRREALGGVTALPWLEGYAVGEDLYLSLVARAHGPLWVNPALRVWHHRSTASRPGDTALAYSTIVNPYRLVRLQHGSWWNDVALGWALVGLVLKDLGRPWRWRLVAGYVRGLRDVLRERWRAAGVDEHAEGR